MENLKTVTNKKGNIGWIVGIWNFKTFQTEIPESNTLEAIAKKVEIMSCGKKQMTCFEKNDAKMAKKFFSPTKEVYATLEDAKKAGIELIDDVVKTDWIPSLKKGSKGSILLSALESDRLIKRVITI